MERRNAKEASAPRRGGAIPIQEALESFLKGRGLGPVSLSGRVFSAWRKAAGTALARRAVPVRFSRGELTVEVSSATHFQELANFTGETYRIRANEILGGDRIRSVAFKRKS